MPDLASPTARLSAAVAALDRARDAFLAALDAVPSGVRATRPAPDAWSADDVAEHLMRTERGLLGGLERQVTAGDARRDVGPPDAAALDRLLAHLDDDGFRYAMPEKAAPFIAPDAMDPADVRREWDDLAARWHRLTETFPVDFVETGLVRHPLIGAVTAEGTARFVAAHIVHHQRQLQRILAAVAPDGLAA